MTLTELRYIIAVAREGHFGHAAKACFVSQPTLSLGIKKLEDELDVLIFERGRKDIVITSAGKKIIKQAEKVLKEVKGITDIARSSIDPLHTPLRIAAIYTIGPYLFPALLPILKLNASKLPLIVEENFTANLSAKLKIGDIDMAILSLPFDEPGIETMPLYREPFALLLPSSHPLASQENIEISDLYKETILLLGQQHCFRDQILEICPHCAVNLYDNDDLQRTLSGSSIETLRYMVASGIGITILPCTASCEDQYKQGLLTVRRVKALDNGRIVALAWRKSFPNKEVVQTIARSIQQCPIKNVEMLATRETNHIEEQRIACVS